MATAPRILAFAASARRESLNRKFLAAAVAEVSQAGAQVTFLQPDEIAMPLYNGDLEDAGGMPPNAVKMVGLLGSHDALLIASPEYNSMITPMLKNTLDWCSRTDGDPFDGKVAAVISASPGILGGVRSLQLAQQLLLKLGCHVLPGQCILPHADKAFDADGRLADPRALKSLKGMAARLVLTATKLAG
jgi:chromate reductase, NAD(P)H dehydrogenase (quinone)